MKQILALALAIISACAAVASEPIEVQPHHRLPDSPWQGKRVGILGDSMSDSLISATSRRFYDYLSDINGIRTFAYARSGHRWKDLMGKARKMKAEHPDDLDAILIWCGTNDFNASAPMGEFFTTDTLTVNADGVECRRLHRTHVMADSTFCGSVNMLMDYLKREFPAQQIVILTPIHRAYARFSSHNVQPDESYANARGLFIDDYVAALRRAGEVWSVPVIDLFSTSGLYPLIEAHDRYIAKPATDRLHPNDAGHLRIAFTVARQLESLQPGFTR